MRGLSFFALCAVLRIAALTADTMLQRANHTHAYGGRLGECEPMLLWFDQVDRLIR